jgi:CRISPR-associated protein (TIGR02710 family)
MVNSKIKNIPNNEEKLALFIPVGTGLGGSEGAESLAYGLLYLIKQQNPDRVVFFTTELSNKTTMKSLKEPYKVEFGKNLNKISQFIKINDIDDFNEFYDKITNQINALSNYRIIVDYTSGTKTMTMAACIAATVNRLDLMFVSGKRGEDHIVQRGSEVLRSQDLNKVYLEKSIKDSEELYNQYRFKQAISKLEELIFIDGDEDFELNRMSHLFMYGAYNYWDEFNHEIALKSFDIHFYMYFKKLSKQIKSNIKALKIINDDKDKLQDYYILASMINNARRRGEEGRYDDAIARLYRCMELMAKIVLNDFGVDPNNVDIKMIQAKSDIAYYNISGKLMRGQHGVLRMPGIDSMYMLIYNLNNFNKMGQFYFKHRNDYLKVLQHRNQSILAHGLEMRDEDDYDDFYKGVMSLAERLDEHMNDYIKSCEFPKF